MENHSEKFNQIVNTARRLFSLYGYKRVSMNEIAKESHVVKNTIYSYFKDKEALLNYFFEEELHNMQRIVEEIEKEALSFFDRLHKMIYSLLHYRNQQQFLITITKEAQSLQTQSAITALHDLDGKIMKYLEGKLQSWMDNKEMRVCNAKLISFLIFHCYTALIYHMDDFHMSDMELSDQITTFLKQGLSI